MSPTLKVNPQMTKYGMIVIFLALKFALNIHPVRLASIFIRATTRLSN